MSNKNKLSYYFSNKSTSSNEICDVLHITTVDKDITNANEILILNELNRNSSTSSSSSITACSEFRTQVDKNLNLNENGFITTKITTAGNNKSLSDWSRANSFKRDPGRGPEAAKEFLLLSPYQPVTTFPTVKHRHFCVNWYKIYQWVEFEGEFTRNNFKLFTTRFVLA